MYIFNRWLVHYNSLIKGSLASPWVFEERKGGRSVGFLDGADVGEKGRLHYNAHGLYIANLL